MVHKTKIITGILIIILLSNIVVNATPNVSTQDINISESTVDDPGGIIDIFFLNSYPTIGKPVDIILKIRGNPRNPPIKINLTITDEYNGLIFKDENVCWKTANITIKQIDFTIGRKNIYLKKIIWNPVIAGNHTLNFKIDGESVKTKNISIGYVSDNIIYPSLGAPSIISKEDFEQLTLLLSEKRHISDEYLKIEEVILENINGSTSYTLDDEQILSAGWIIRNKDQYEDLLSVKYNITSIPNGFYNLTVKTGKNTYFWPHAVYIIENEEKNYSFIQLSDLHIEKNYNLFNEKKILNQIFETINEEQEPAFIVLTGDLVDWNKVKLIKNIWIELQNIIIKSNYPVFTAPGNHERYAKNLRYLYNPFDDNTEYHKYINPIVDYSFSYSDINYVILDSGYDWSRWEIKRQIWSPSPEGSGLTNNQMYLIENELGTNKTNQIILMHHPAVNTEDDKGLFFIPDDHQSGNNECIAFNRVEFVNYCINNNVSLVLSGHTHQNIILNSLGLEPISPYTWPLFVQTISATTNRKSETGRIIEIENGIVSSFNIF